MSGRHGDAGRSEDQTLQESRRLCPGARRALTRAVPQDSVHPVPEGAIDDSLVLARIGRALVNGLTDIDAVVEQLVEIPLVDELAPLAADILVSKRCNQFRC